MEHPSPVSEFLHAANRMEDSVAALRGTVPTAWQRSIRDSVQSLLGIPPGTMTGVINVDVFMMESTGGACVYNWTATYENRVIGEWLRAFDFWSRAATRYGRSVTFRGSWFRSSATAMHVVEEPLRVPKELGWTLVKEVLNNLGYDHPWGDPVLGGIGAFFSLPFSEAGQIGREPAFDLIFCSLKYSFTTRATDR